MYRIKTSSFRFVYKLLFSITTFLFLACSSGEYDSRAIEQLDKLAETIGNLDSCSYTLNTYKLEADSTEIFIESDMYMRGPNKMYVYSVNSDKGERGMWYNGTKFAYYSFDNLEYDTIAAPENLLLAIDFVHTKYGIDFPAGDFFYPTFTDDIIRDFDNVWYEGDVTVDGVDCISILATNDSQELQLWIVKENNLPYKMAILSKEDKDEYYEATFSNWRSNPELPDLLFEFYPPSNSKRANLLNKK